jgi:hypothetical protein
MRAPQFGQRSVLENIESMAATQSIPLVSGQFVKNL